MQLPQCGLKLELQILEFILANPRSKKAGSQKCYKAFSQRYIVEELQVEYPICVLSKIQTSQLAAL